MRVGEAQHEPPRLVPRAQVGRHAVRVERLERDAEEDEHEEPRPPRAEVS